VLVHVIGRHVVGDRTAVWIVDWMQIAAAAILRLPGIWRRHDGLVVLEHGPVRDLDEQALAIIVSGDSGGELMFARNGGQPVTPGLSAGSLSRMIQRMRPRSTWTSTALFVSSSVSMKCCCFRSDSGN
jgi:hypothetical protein